MRKPSGDSDRRRFLTGAGAAGLAAASIAGTANKAEAQTAAGAWHPARHSQDDWLEQKHNAKHRLVFDTTTPAGLSEALFFGQNYLAINNSDYGIPNSELAVVVIVRYQSVAFGYNDSIWAKYAAPIAARTKYQDPKTKSPAKLNVYNSEAYSDVLMNAPIDSVTKLGVQLAVCNLATRNMSIAIAKAVDGVADTIYKELASNLVHGARLVPAGIVAVNRAQERGYTLVAT
jgi:intracellular sulfur oxidation DsrE/DsrF family protein